MIILGEGSHRYEWVGDWAKLPPGKEFGRTHGVVTDARDRVYVFNTSRDAVSVFDREGNFVRSWGQEFADGAHGLFLSREKEDEFLFLTDQVRQIVAKTTLDGELIFELGVPSRPDLYATEAEFRPTDVCVAPNGEFYVFDGYGKHWVHRYTATGDYIDSIGGKGSEPGKLDCPHGGWVDTRGPEPVLWVADRGNNRIQKFTLDGEHIGFITSQLRRPCCFFQSGDNMFVPHLDARVTILDRRDQVVACLGDNPPACVMPGWPEIHQHLKLGLFNSPHACCVDSFGDLYVVEWITKGRVTKLRHVE